MPRRPDPEYVRALKGKKPRIPVDERISFPSEVTLRPPDYLTPEGQHHWERMVLILSPIGLLQEVGRDKLARYCQACADYEEIMMARKDAGKKKRLYDPGMNYWMKQLKQHSDEMKDFEKEYGLTPASSARVRRPGSNSGGKSPQEKFKDFLDDTKKVS